MGNGLVDVGIVLALGGLALATCADDETRQAGTTTASGAGGTHTGGTGGTGGSGAAGAGAGTGGMGAFGGGGAGGQPPTCTQDVSPGTDLGPIAQSAQPGDVICLAAGDYGPFRIPTGGTSAEPIWFRARDGDEQLARITDNGTFSQGIRVENTAHVIIDGLWVDEINQGIYVYYSDHVVVRNCRVTRIGQECLRFKHSSYGAFLFNDVDDCGLRYQEGMNGEGIYVGSGEENGDDTHDVTVRGNHIRNAKDEGIELKGSTSNCLVEGNVVHDLLIRDGGGITVSTPDLPDASLNDSGHVVRGNVVYAVSTRTQYQDGNGLNVRRGATVVNNVSWGNQHYGIRIDDKEGRGALVTALHNTFYGNGVDDVGVFDSAVTDLRNNLGLSATDNLAATADLFVDAAGGDFHLVPGAAAVDAGSDVGVAIDIEGTPRPQGAGFDFGAYER
ncbi:MAG: right-handed parallel beta-helix repeat-containing protein [Deltaproteobacteria bacterium]|nr:right-handed parallel beta-helix repeat-containing protein [Deltaproteobacteria bacterium]MBW2534148.1 right-handed parallel beta-helix repeat-containing protein [Deltaproteobacteria bacterium]